MILTPSSVAELQELLATASSRGETVRAVDLSALNSLVEHVPQDMTASVQAGMSFSDFQARLTEFGQWLPLDPFLSPGLTVGQVIASNLTGPRRLGFGTARDYLIGLRAVLPDGQLIRAGGKVVKNVAGYDLCKLFVGGGLTLGVVVEATFKLRPLPETESFFFKKFTRLEEAGRFTHSILDSGLSPVVLDLYRFDFSTGSPPFTVVAGFAGATEDVEEQSKKMREVEAVPLSTDPLGYNAKFFEQTAPPPFRLSVLPSRVIETLSKEGGKSFIARAGNGEIWLRGEPRFPAPPNASVLRLHRRLKNAFDPSHIMPELTL